MPFGYSIQRGRVRCNERMSSSGVRDICLAPADSRPPRASVSSEGGMGGAAHSAAGSYAIVGVALTEYMKNSGLHPDPCTSGDSGVGGRRGATINDIDAGVSAIKRSLIRPKLGTLVLRTVASSHFLRRRELVGGVLVARRAVSTGQAQVVVWLAGT